MQNIGKSDPYFPGRVQADSAASFVLSAGVEQHLTIPALATVAVFSATDVFYVLVNNQTAVVPFASNFTFPVPNTVPELSPMVLDVVAGNVMSVVAPSATILVVSFYRYTDLS